MKESVVLALMWARLQSKSKDGISKDERTKMLPMHVTLKAAVMI